MNKDNLVEDYELARLRMDTKISELRLVAEEEMSENQHKEHKKLASELNDNLLKNSHFEIETLLVFICIVRMISEYKYYNEKWQVKQKDVSNTRNVVFLCWRRAHRW